MERSTGANTIPNLFGAGKDGFGDGVGPPPTDLNASWFNNTQEEICRAIEDQGFAVGGTLDQLTVALNSWGWSGNPKIKSGGKLSILSGGMQEVESGGTFQALAGAIAAFSGTTIFTPGSTFDCDTLATFTKDVTLGDDVADAIIVSGTMTVNEDATFVKDVIGPFANVIKYGTIELLSGAPAPAARQLAAGVGGELAWHDGSSAQFVHYSTNGWVYATGDQEAATGLAVTQLVATTTVATPGTAGGTVRVILYGQAQVNVLGSTLTVDVQEDKTANPAYTPIGVAQVMTATHTQVDVNAWQHFRHERTFVAGSTDTLYRASIVANGGNTVSVKEVRVKVVNERA